MTVFNEPPDYNINDEVAGSTISAMEKTITKENDISFSAIHDEVEDESSFCFVLGYN